MMRTFMSKGAGSKGEGIACTKVEKRSFSRLAGKSLQSFECAARLDLYLAELINVMYV